MGVVGDHAVRAGVSIGVGRPMHAGAGGIRGGAGVAHDGHLQGEAHARHVQQEVRTAPTRVPQTEVKVAAEHDRVDAVGI